MISEILNVFIYQIYRLYYTLPYPGLSIPIGFVLMGYGLIKLSITVFHGINGVSTLFGGSQKKE